MLATGTVSSRDADGTDVADRLGKTRPRFSGTHPHVAAAVGERRGSTACVDARGDGWA